MEPQNVTPQEFAKIVEDNIGKAFVYEAGEVTSIPSSTQVIYQFCTDDTVYQTNMKGF